MASSFYKILLEPSADHLSLPPDFLTTNKIPNTTIIKSANGGYSWKLKIKQIGNGYCFSDGWENVVQDIQFGYGDFLLFRLLDQSTFEMLVYCPDGCEKILPQKVDNNYEKNEDPSFVSVITRTHKRMLRFPAGFAEMVGIVGEGTMTVKNLDGKEWVVGLRLDKSYRSSKRYLLSPGWPDFQRENDLSEGDECVFMFVRSEGKLLLAEVTKNKFLATQP